MSDTPTPEAGGALLGVGAPMDDSDAGDDTGTPIDLLELHEVLEWQAAVDALPDREPG